MARKEHGWAHDLRTPAKTHIAKAINALGNAGWPKDLDADDLDTRATFEMACVSLQRALENAGSAAGKGRAKELMEYIECDGAEEEEETSESEKSRDPLWSIFSPDAAFTEEEKAYKKQASEFFWPAASLKEERALEDRMNQSRSEQVALEKKLRKERDIEMSQWDKKKDRRMMDSSDYAEEEAARKKWYDTFVEHGLDGIDDDFDLDAELESGVVISDARGAGYAISAEGKDLGYYVEDWDDAVGVANLWMAENKYWPNLFYVNERGNVDLLNEDGSVLRSWV